MSDMKISILGASQGTGAQAVKLALERGHDVLAFARHPDKLELAHSKLTRLAGDFHDPESVDAAVRGQDAVIVTASSTTLKGFKENPTYFSKGTGHTIDAMKRHGVRRLVVLSALGTGESLKLMNFLAAKLVVGFLLKAAFEDHERQEKLVRASGLDWVIARPGKLTNGPARGRYIKTAKIEPVPNLISRADVADFLVSASELDTWVRQAVQLGG
jgi:uncharacterized protein YbjT (DUF2867 family)